jgi:hypothetical protein
MPRSPFTHIFLVASLGLLALSQTAYSKDTGPQYSEIVSTLESQPLGENAQLVYFDQSVADALGIHLPPGRVGLQDFNRAVLKKLGFEIKQGAKKIHAANGARDEKGNPYIYVENDAFGGSGRAGYIEVEPGVWVNIKGIGKTGMGNAAGSDPSPPQDTFVSHSDGSATLEESIKETIMARVADDETTMGSSRVLAIIYTGRTMRYPDGKMVPLATIVRAPMRRYDQPHSDPRMVAASLGEANAKRLLKGDFVNQSNMGAHGEWIDFGTMTFTEGYAPLISSQDEKFLFEGSMFLGDTANQNVYLESFGKGLLQQMGIPESNIEKLGLDNQATKDKLEQLAKTFRSSVYWVKGEPRELASTTLLDFNHVPEETLLGNVNFDEYLRGAAKNYFHASNPDEAYKSELQRLLGLARDQDDALAGDLSSLVKETHALFESIAKANQISDRASYGEKLGQVASFKNRSLPGLVRPNLFNNAGSLADNFVNNHNSFYISDFIDTTISSNRLETNPDADNLIVTSADSQSTKVFMRAYEDENQVKKLFSFPDHSGAKKGEKFSFRVSTDGWKSHKDFPAWYTHTALGDYFEIDIPHGSMPVTFERLQVTPFVLEESGQIRWLGENLNLMGPPVFFNERLGLPESFARRDDVMRDSFSTKISIHPDDLIPYGSSCDLNLMHP